MSRSARWLATGSLAALDTLAVAYGITRALALSGFGQRSWSTR